MNDKDKQEIIERVARQIDELTRQEMAVFSERTICQLSEIVGKESLGISAMVLCSREECDEHCKKFIALNGKAK